MEDPTGTPECTLSASHYLRPRAHRPPHRSIPNFVTTAGAPLRLFTPAIIYIVGTGLRSPTSPREGSGPTPHPPCYMELLPDVETDVRAHSLFASRSATTGAHDRSGGKLLWLGFGGTPPEPCVTPKRTIMVL